MIDKADLAKGWALEDIDELQSQGLISSDVAQRGREFVESMFPPGCIYATVAPDSDDICFYWVAGKRSIEVDLYADGGCWASEHNGPVKRTGDFDAVPDWIRESLVHFSAAVEKANPAWPELREREKSGRTA